MTCHPVHVAELLPFRALRPEPELLASMIAPPYDVMNLDEVRRWRASHPANITHVDVALPEDGGDPYNTLARRVSDWITSGTLRRDGEPSLTIHRMSFIDAAGTARTISGVIGALEVTEGSAVLAHERTTPKASSDRYDLTVATEMNLSPVWGLALGAGLTEVLRESGREAHIAAMRDSAAGSVTHRWEVVDDPTRIMAIQEVIARDDVLIADGHHRYGVARRVAEDHGRRLPGARHTLAFVSDLTEDQLSVAAIHRVYGGIDAADLRRCLESGYRLIDGGVLDTARGAASLPSAIAERGQPCLIGPDGSLTWLELDGDTLALVRDLDGARLEHLLADIDHEVQYLHDPVEAAEQVMNGRCSSAVLIRPVGISEITRTGRTGELMPPKSTFFSPKLPTGAVLRQLDGH